MSAQCHDRDSRAPDRGCATRFNFPLLPPGGKMGGKGRKKFPGDQFSALRKTTSCTSSYWDGTETISAARTKTATTPVSNHQTRWPSQQSKASPVGRAAGNRAAASSANRRRCGSGRMEERGTIHQRPPPASRIPRDCSVALLVACLAQQLRSPGKRHEQLAR